MDDVAPDGLPSPSEVEGFNDLRWLIAAGVEVTIGAVQRGDCAELRVVLDLDDQPTWWGDLAGCLAEAKAYCAREGIGP